MKNSGWLALVVLVTGCGDSYGGVPNSQPACGAGYFTMLREDGWECREVSRQQDGNDYIRRCLCPEPRAVVSSSAVASGEPMCAVVIEGVIFEAPCRESP